MQFMPYREPEWQKSLSGLLGTLGDQGAKTVDTYYQSKNKRELEKKEKEKKDTERSQQAHAYATMFGISPEQANALVTAPPDIQRDMVKQIMDRGGFQKMSGMGGNAPMPGMQSMQGQGSPMDALQQLGSPQSEQVPNGALAMSNAAQSLRPEDPGSFLAQRVLQGAASGTPFAKEQPQKPSLTPEQQQKKEISQLVANYDINQGIDMSPTNISGLMGMGMSKKEADAALKKTYDYDEGLLQRVDAAKGLNPVMSRMLELVEKDEESGGNLLRGPKMQTLLHSLEGYQGKGSFGGLGAAIGGLLGSVIPGLGTAIGAGIGGGLGALGATATESLIKSNATKETQEFEKLSAEFIKGAKGIFGSRITDNDLSAFMKMVPTLSNTNEGKMAIIRNLQLLNKATILEGEIRNEIKKQNGGKLPSNLKEMIEEIAKPIMDRISEQWKKDTERLFEKYGQSGNSQNQGAPSESMRLRGAG